MLKTAVKDVKSLLGVGLIPKFSSENLKYLLDAYIYAYKCKGSQ